MALGIDRAGARGFLMGEAKEVGGHAAGTIHVAPDGSILLLHRAPTEQNFGGHWGLPGGKVEPGESIEAGADRETAEETGFYSEVPKKLLHQVITPNKWAFHTYVRPVSEKFAPEMADGEHTGYTWASLGMLPEPLHPSLKDCLSKIPGSAELLQWASEPEHADMALDEAFDVLAGELLLAQDQELLGMDRAPEGLDLDRHGVAVKMAFDKAPEGKQGKTEDRFDRMHVKRAPITKACVNPYYGREIPKGKQLGLDPDKIYRLLRSPEELQKAAATFQNLPLLSEHVPHTADAHDGDITVGTVGSNAEYKHPYLYNSLAVWSREGRDYAEGDQKELSSAYHYDADMTPGTYEGEPYDGVMRNMVGNHVCLVKKGRAGSDVALDEALQPQQENSMSKKFATLKASVAASAVAAYLQPQLAMDSAVNVHGALATFKPKQFKQDKKKFLAALQKHLVGKLAQDSAMSGVLAGVGKIMDSIEGNDAVSDEAAEIDPALADEADAMDGGMDAIKAYLKEKGVPDDIIAGMPTGETEVEAEPAPKEEVVKPAPEKKAIAEDGPTDDMEARLADGGKKKIVADADIERSETGPDGDDDKFVSKGAMDAALKKARADTMATMNRVQEARKHVRPTVGELDMAFDSAEGVYRHAFKMIGKEIPKAVAGEAALQAMWDLVPARGRAPEPAVAMDSASVKSFNERFPHLSKVKAG